MNLLLILRRQAGISGRPEHPFNDTVLQCTVRLTVHGDIQCTYLLTLCSLTYSPIHLLTYWLTYLLTVGCPAPKHAVHKALWRIYILCRGEKFNLFHIGLFWIKWVDVPQKDGQYKELSNAYISNFHVSSRYVRGRLYPQRQIERYIYFECWKLNTCGNSFRGQKYAILYTSMELKQKNWGLERHINGRCLIRGDVKVSRRWGYNQLTNRGGEMTWRPEDNQIMWHQKDETESLWDC